MHDLLKLYWVTYPEQFHGTMRDFRLFAFIFSLENGENFQVKPRSSSQLRWPLASHPCVMCMMGFKILRKGRSGGGGWTGGN